MKLVTRKAKNNFKIFFMGQLLVTTVSGVAIKFFCKSSLKWNICQWLRPNTVNRPCQSFSSSGSTSCDAVWQRSNNRPEYDDGSSYDIEDRYALIDFILFNRAILLTILMLGRFELFITFKFQPLDS